MRAALCFSRASETFSRFVLALMAPQARGSHLHTQLEWQLTLISPNYQAGKGVRCSQYFTGTLFIDSQNKKLFPEEI